MSETTLSGRLLNQKTTDFSGHRVVVHFDETVDGDTVESRVETVANPDGTFLLHLPSEDTIAATLRITVLGPSSATLGEASVDLGNAPGEVRIEVADPPPPTNVRPSEDPTLGRDVRYSGRLFDSSGTGADPGVLIVLFGESLGGGDPYPLGITETGLGGYISGPWPPDRLATAFARVPDGRTIDIVLVDERLPLRLLLVLDPLPDVDAESEGCCDEGVPRAPGQTELVENASTFSADSSGCVDLTIPNRTLEEVAFQAVVRTSQPEIKGRPRPPRSTTPPWVIGKVTDLARLDLDLRARLIASETGPGDDASSPAPSGTAGGRAAGGVAASDASVSLAGRAALVADLSVRPILDDTALARVNEARDAVVAASLDTDVASSAILTDRVQNDRPLELADSVIRDLARESGSITPRRLLEAERTSVMRNVRDAVSRLHRPRVGRFELSAKRRVAWDTIPLENQATTIAHGHLLTFKQVWKADGYSLGDLLYSLPLAPGQQKLVSVLDWDRRETASRIGRRSLEEGVASDLSHDRDITEIVRSTFHEEMTAMSRADTKAGGAAFGGFIGPVVFGGGGGVSSAGSEASQTSARRVTGSVLNRARDRTFQSASALRSQRSTVVQSARQGESVRAQTEVLANYNHCHAVTVEYFEVLRHFQVHQELAAVQECLLIPFAITAFDTKKALRWRAPLVRGLRRRSLRSAFASAKRVDDDWANADVPETRYADEPLRHLAGEFRVRISLPVPKDDEDDDFDENEWAPYEQFLKEDEEAEEIWERYMGVALPRDRPRIWNRRIAPGIAQRMVGAMKLELGRANNVFDPVELDTTLVSGFRQGRSHLVTFRPLRNLPTIDRAQVRRVRISLPGVPPNVDVMVERGSMSYRTDHLNHRLFTNFRILNDLGVDDYVEILTPLDRLEKRNPKQRDRRRRDALLDHLNEHIEYYHRAIWLQMDSNRRFMLLDGLVAPNASGRSVASLVENRVLGVAGNSLIMPLSPGIKLDTTYEFADADFDDLVHLYAAEPPPPMRISVPTQGVFAEAVQGKCNSCELIDDTRFWRFEEAPIPDSPTAISPLSTDSRRSEPPDVSPDAFPDPLVRLIRTPDAPAPTGMAAALELIGTKDVFKDITGLAQNQANAAQAFKSAMGTAQSFAKHGAALAQQRFMDKELDRTLKRIKAAKEKGLISTEQTEKLTTGAFESALGEVRPDVPDPLDNEAVDRSVERFNSSSSGVLRAANAEGEIELKKGADADGTIDVSVDPPVVPIKQLTNMVCWAAGGTMMRSWRNGFSQTVEDTLDELGGGWRAKYDANQGLSSADFISFAQILGLKDRNQSFTAAGFAMLLENGPVLVISDDAVENNFVAHVRIATGMSGDGTPTGTSITFADSATGAFHTETYQTFAAKLIATDPVRFGLGVYHY